MFLKNASPINDCVNRSGIILSPLANRSAMYFVIRRHPFSNSTMV